MTALTRWLPSVPLLDWGRQYNRDTFTNDAVAALIVTIMLIPQSLAYALLAGLPPGGAVDAAEADRWIEALGLTERRDADPATLSAGERQRVALARALVKRPPLILADEPTGNLDPDNAARVLEHLDGYRRSGGTVVLVTHGSEANRYATQRLRLEAGRWVSPSSNAPSHASAS